METKICSKCGTEYPLAEEYYRKRKESADGYRNECKICAKAVSKLYTAAHKAQKAEYDKQYNQINRDEIIKKKSVYTHNNKEKKREYDKLYREAKKEILPTLKRQEYEKHKDRYRESSKQYYLCNKEQHLINSRQYYETHKEQLLRANAEYRKRHPEQSRFALQRRRARKRELASTLTVSQWEVIKQSFNNCCAYCGSEAELFQEHVTPLVKGGTYTSDNIIPACKSCNSSKGTKQFKEWYRKQKFYTKQREQHIINCLNREHHGEQLSFNTSESIAQ